MKTEKTRVFAVQEPMAKTVDPVTNDIRFTPKYDMEPVRRHGEIHYIYQGRQPFSTDCTRIALAFLRQHHYDPSKDLFMATGHQFLVVSATAAVSDLAAEQGVPFKLLIYSNRYGRYDVLPTGEL
jgi:hypothetical protein